MTKNADSEPWRALPATVANLIEPELDAVTEEILDAIGRQVPEYARPLEGSFGRGVRTGVGEALRQFVALVRDPGAGRGPGREVYRALGRGELRQGRTLDSLQAAYRVGARVAWRHLSLTGREASLAPEVLSLLAEAIFAYIDELSADSVEGYAEAQSEVEDERRRRRRDLAALLTRDPPAEEADLRAAVEAAAWRLPATIAAAACAEGDLGTVARRLPPDCLATTLDEVGCILISDPRGPGRSAEIERAAAGAPLALGPVGPLTDLASSWSLARGVLRASGAGAIQPSDLLLAEEHLSDLLLFEGSALARRMASRRLAAFDALTPRARDRMLDTALAYFHHQGSSTAMAEALGIHPQTARYRTARLRELLGDQLDDPDIRFEVELALRHTKQSDRAASTAAAS